MKEINDWFAESIGTGRLKGEDAQQVACLIFSLRKQGDHNRDLSYDVGLYSAMLADLCQLRFGSQAKGAPSLLSLPHAHWACSPAVDHQRSYVRQMIAQSHKNDHEILDKKLREVDAWEAFIHPSS